MDTRRKGEGVPRGPEEESRFRQTGKGVRKAVGIAPGQPTVSNGKLFGKEPLLSQDGKSSSQGGAGGSDDELTPEELALLAARIDALAMTPEERENAERVGGELWEMMQKIGSGEMTLEEEEGEVGAVGDGETVERGVDGSTVPGVKSSKKRPEVQLGQVQERTSAPDGTQSASRIPESQDAVPPPAKIRKLSQFVAVFFSSFSPQVDLGNTGSKLERSHRTEHLLRRQPATTSLQRRHRHYHLRSPRLRLSRRRESRVSKRSG